MDVSELLGSPISQVGREYGNGIGFYDINNDGFDDITVPVINDSLICLLSNGSSFTRIHPVYCNGQVKQALWGDYDNDGDPDLYITFYAGVNKLYENDGSLNFTDVTNQMGVESDAWQSYGASWGDVNNDGWLDLVVAVYNEGLARHSWMFMNHEGQFFTEESINRGLNEESDFTFQPSFLDVNGDLYPEIHLANDRAPDDGLLINNIDYYSNAANAMGIDGFCNSMSSSIADFDNDGDLDIYVSNTMEGNFFWMKTSDLYYYNIASAAGVAVNAFCWGANWIDYNNDGWEDLFVNNHPGPGATQPFFMNINGNGFEQHNGVSNIEGSWSSFSASKGDFNNDGYPDLAINPDEGLHVKLLTSTGTNNWIKIKLQGQVSNRDGIGAWIEYVPEGSARRYRYTRNGTGYLMQDSQWMILGLGEAEMVEELVIRWPSGIIETFYNIPAGQISTYIEGYENLMVVDENSSPFQIEEIHLCPGETVTLYSNATNSTTWNTGAETSSLNVNESGIYYFTSISDAGVINFSNAINVVFEEINAFEIISNNPICAGDSNGSVQIIDPLNEWVLSSEGTSLNNLNAGIYTFSLQHISGCIAESMTVELNDPAMPALDFTTTNALCYNEPSGNIFLLETNYTNAEIINPSNQEFIPIESAEVSLSAGQYQLIHENLNGCVGVQYFEIFQPDPLQLNVVSINDEVPEFNLIAMGGTSPYQFYMDDVLIGNSSSVILENMNHVLQVIDANGCSATGVILDFPQLPEIVSVEDINSNYLNKPYYQYGKIVNVSEENRTYKIYNALGQILMQGLIFNQEIPLNLNSQMILLELTDQSGGVKSFKLIVQ
jgi:hypothetical protein